MSGEVEPFGNSVAYSVACLNLKLLYAFFGLSENLLCGVFSGDSGFFRYKVNKVCLLYTSDAADD